MDTTKLEAHGVEIIIDPYKSANAVSGVYLALTPEEWCSIAMRDGEHYIGGCCSQTAYIQDEINGIFRDSGFADASSLYALGEMISHHPDGFEDFNEPMSQEKFDEQCSKWDELDPWAKIALVYQGVHERLRPRSTDLEPIVQENRPDLDEKREVDELFTGLRYWHYHFIRSFGKDNESGQSHGNDVLATARLLPGCRRLLKKLEADLTTWDGFAIVEKARPEVVCHNGYGVCLYNIIAAAEEVRQLWKDELREKTLVRACSVSVSDGLIFKEDGQ